MMNEDIIQHYDYLMRLAVSKCNSRTDAEDLVGDTMLAAFVFLQNGGEIEHPKTWLVNTLYHKHNDNLRRKYRSPITVSLDEYCDIADNEDETVFLDDEAKLVRKELNHLAFVMREVMIRYYYGSQSVADIANGLQIPEGTVKRRLFTGRAQIKKGLETMEIRENYLPGQLYLSFGGSDGVNGEPMSLVEGDLIAQNLLILAYEKPITIPELSKAIAIPAAYIEPIIKKLVDGELMIQTESGKVYTDFLIRKPQDALENFRPQLDFAHKHFDSIWAIIQGMEDKITQLPFVQSMGDDEKVKLGRYAVLKALQDFQHYGTGRIEPPKFPKRRDGGRWYAQATALDAEYNTKEYKESLEYTIHGGHRTTEALSVAGTKRIRLCEFDTTLWDSPHRYGDMHFLYFKHIVPLLWHIHSNIPLEESDIPNEFISYIPTLSVFGLIGNTGGKLCVKIPVLEKTEYDNLNAVIKNTTAELKSVLGEEFAAFIGSMRTPVPKHLTTVPELYRYIEATKYFVMAVVRQAYNKGLHLKDVNYCCPPAVLVYEK